MDFRRVTIKRLSKAILETPTGPERNLLSDAKLVIQADLTDLRSASNEIKKLMTRNVRMADEIRRLKGGL